MGFLHILGTRATCSKMEGDDNIGLLFVVWGEEWLRLGNGLWLKGALWISECACVGVAD